MAENIVLISWTDANKPYKALSDLRNGNWTFNLRQAVLLERKADGSLVVKDGNSNALGMGTFGGSLIGMLIGVLGGPLGVLLGWAGGALFGSLIDMDNAADSDSILAAMSKFVPPGATVLMLDVVEQSPEALDAFAAESGGTVLRRSAADVRAEVTAAVEAANAASREASRVLRDEKVDKAKDKLEQGWDDLKAKFKHAFS